MDRTHVVRDLIVPRTVQYSGALYGKFRTHHIHWGLPDPAAVTGSDDNIRRAFTDCFELLQARIRKLTRRMTREMDMAQLSSLMQDLASGLSCDHSLDHSVRHLEKSL